jgi:PST family polysaccharide transporter
MAVVATLAPGLARLRSTGDRVGYLAKVERMMTGLAAIAIMISLPTMVLSPLVVDVLLGSAFEGAGVVLAIHISSLLFVFLGVAQSVWATNESLQRLVMWQTLAGAFVNVVLNLVLIPSLGAVGAALATVVGYAVASWLANFIFQPTRSMFFLQSRALRPGNLWSVGRHEVSAALRGRRRSDL